MATSKHGLGRGLSALISENNLQPTPTAVDSNKPSGVDSVPSGKLHAGKYQPRTRFDETMLSELADSIRKNGMMQPIIVRPSAKQSGKFEIVAGERRWRAAKIAGLDQLPVIVREITDQQALELALVENIQRQDLSPLEEAAGYQRLIEEFNYTQEELAGTVGKSRSHIANLLRLLALPDEVKQMLDSGKLTMGHARALLNAPDPAAKCRGMRKRRSTALAAHIAGPSIKIPISSRSKNRCRRISVSKSPSTTAASRAKLFSPMKPCRSSMKYCASSEAKSANWCNFLSSRACRGIFSKRSFDSAALRSG